MIKKNILGSLKLPQDLKSLSAEDTRRLCDEIRQKIIRTVSVNGGHLASNLGVVELTVAINKIFNRPNDKLVWDVGHQCYTDKILTGRLDKIDTIRKEGGLSGFPKMSESEYDAFNVGHSSTSISVALGLARAKRMQAERGKVIAVIGDGSLTGGLAYEGLNNISKKDSNLVIILNDNKMSISKNVGSMARYLAKIRTRTSYIRAKDRISGFLQQVPLVGRNINSSLKKIKTSIKGSIYNSTLFEDMGLAYYGPIDGHNLEELYQALRVVKHATEPVLLHVITKKGKGYEYAEKSPNSFHGLSAFNIKTGKSTSSGENYSKVFGDTLCEIAKNDDKICAITAAMTDGTGLTDFSQHYENRFFDVGIEEGHAVTFSGGLAVGGMKPVFAVYSTFIQRSYDQLIHDVAMQKAKVVLAIDRAGIVGEDGETHQGIFDVAMLNTIPNSVIYSPSFFGELKRDLKASIYKQDTLTAVRYPRGGEGFKPKYYQQTNNPFDTYFDGDIAVVTYGRIFSSVCLAKEKLKEYNINIKIIKLNIIKPISPDAVCSVVNCKGVLFVEEGCLKGGVAQVFGSMLNNIGFKGEYIINAIDDMFVQHASTESALKKLGLDEESITQQIVNLAESMGKL